MFRRGVATLLLALSSLPALAQAERHFTFHYAFTVKNVASGERLRVWIPLAHSDPYQTVNVTSQAADLPLKKVAQPRDGNILLYAETAKAGKGEYTFAVDYDVVRREHVVLTNGQSAPSAQAEPLTASDRERFLAPDKLVPISGVPAQLAADQTKTAATQLEKSRAIYDYVFRTMKYDKTGTGWGHGDTLWACDSKRGNCTDFHSVFISMARSQKIPARFQIGFPLPADKTAAEVPGYHCWAEFYLDRVGWIPVDISEAWKHQDKHDYFFGAHDVNRMQFTQGRDLILSPAQDGPPLNYFVYPYVEVAGKEHSNISIALSFAEATPAPTNLNVTAH